MSITKLEEFLKIGYYEYMEQDRKHPPFVKKFDFRGVYDKDITDRDAFLLGKALQSVLTPRKVLVGYDTRVSSMQMAEHFIRAFSIEEQEVHYLPKCPIDYVTAASFSLDYDLSVMFTGSHNPWDWTGLLIHLSRGDSLQGELVSEVVQQYYQAQEENASETDISLGELKDVTKEVEDVYRKKIETILPIDEIRPFKVLVDIGDGSGTKALELLQTIFRSVEFTMINNRGVYDSQSPHIADPSEIKNMQDVINGVKEGGYDCGFAFDSDADRVLGVDEHGNYLNGSILGSAIAEAIIRAGSADTKFGYAVDCGIAFHNAILELKKNYRELTLEMLPVGRSLLRTMIREGKTDVAVENVGHFYLNDFFKTDSGVFSLALILYWMSLNGKLSALSTKYPDGMRGQRFVSLPDNQDEIMKRLSQTFLDEYGEGNLKKSEVDGLRYEMNKEGKMVSWFATRKSGYEPIQKYFYGSMDETEFKKLEAIVSEITK